MVPLIEYDWWANMEGGVMERDNFDETNDWKDDSFDSVWENAAADLYGENEESVRSSSEREPQSKLHEVFDGLRTEVARILPTPFKGKLGDEQKKELTNFMGSMVTHGYDDVGVIMINQQLEGSGYKASIWKAGRQLFLTNEGDPDRWILTITDKDSGKPTDTIVSKKEQEFRDSQFKPMTASDGKPISVTIGYVLTPKIPLQINGRTETVPFNMPRGSVALETNARGEIQANHSNGHRYHLNRKGGSWSWSRK